MMREFKRLQMPQASPFSRLDNQDEAFETAHRTISGKPEIGAPPQDEVCEFKLHPPDPIGFMESIEYPSASLSKCSNLFALGPRPQRCNKFQGGAAMKLLHRRRFLHLTAGAATLPAGSYVAWAQAYPSRPVHWVVGLAPGGGYDTVARLMGQWLQERLGQPFVIENRPGAGTNIATEAVVRAPPDGYTLLLIGSTNAINATFYQKLNFNFIRDIAPVASITRQPQVMLGSPSLPAKTIPELIGYAKANPGKVNMGSPGIGAISHLAGELFKLMAGVNLQNVPFAGNGPALTALLG
jgi:hypothetical protein